MDQILVIDVLERCITGVVLENGNKAFQIKSHGVAECSVADMAGAIEEVVRQTGYGAGNCRVSLCAGKCIFRNIFIPFADRRKIAQILPLELDEQIAGGIAEYHFDFILRSREHGTEILAALVEKRYLRSVIEALETNGLDPDLVTIGSIAVAASIDNAGSAAKTRLILDVGLNRTTLMVVADGSLTLLRSLSWSPPAEGLSKSGTNANSLPGEEGTEPGLVGEIQTLAALLRQTMIPLGRRDVLEQRGPCYIADGVGLSSRFYLSLQDELGCDVRPLSAEGDACFDAILQPGEGNSAPSLFHRAIALATWKPVNGNRLNFRSGSFKKRLSWKKIRKRTAWAVLPLVVLLAGVVGACWWEYDSLARKRDALQSEIITIFHEAMPGVTRVVNPAQQLAIKIKETSEAFGGKSEDLLGIEKMVMLTELSERIPKSLSVRIDKMVAEADELRITAETTDFQTVDNVKNALEKSAVFQDVTIDSANMAPKGEEIRFEMRMRLHLGEWKS